MRTTSLIVPPHSALLVRVPRKPATSKGRASACPGPSIADDRRVLSGVANLISFAAVGHRVRVASYRARIRDAVWLQAEIARCKKAALARERIQLLESLQWAKEKYLARNVSDRPFSFTSANSLLGRSNNSLQRAMHRLRIEPSEVLEPYEQFEERLVYRVCKRRTLSRESLNIKSILKECHINDSPLCKKVIRRVRTTLLQRERR
jgi:hypothetical protein